MTSAGAAPVGVGRDFTLTPRDFRRVAKVVREVALSETPHYRIMRDFMNNPTMMLERLFNDTPKDDEDL